ncbi:hypothetical protein ROSMUCSMR3_00277 [Roseovarius mucosus]|uniref:Uncharacterized protein n=1 Tax=Roseovarius mucosus TaxID=215743 RepID=A0A1V0RJF3_9RHOB|nr:hypothetical protein [Roseovarius mucosus]ARE81785.1 hypothetical protein ROSMUCSMR3_00277 [Roseovarius mucosus]
MKIKTPDRDVLNKAKMANFNRAAKTAPAKNWVDWLVRQTLAYEAAHDPRKRVRQRKAHDGFEAAIGALGADLLRAYGHEEAEGFMYRPMHREELADTFVTSDSFDKLIKFWGGLGWLEMTGHINSTDDWEGQDIPGYSKVRRYRATASFVASAQEFQLTPDTMTDNFEISHKHADLVQVRKTSRRAYGQKTSGQRVRPKGPKVADQKRLMQRLNQGLLAHTYSLKEPPMMRRLFNCADRAGFDFNLGGRFYCISSDNWMDMPKPERKKIMIDGETTSEIDVSASHLFILYALHGEHLDYGSDPYRVADYPREVIKQIVVSMIGAGKVPERWPKDFNAAYKEEHGHLPNDDYKLKDVVTAILRKHPILKKLKKDKLDWANLQFEESECFLSTMLELHELYDVTSLPIHDSLIVRQSDKTMAERVLGQAYKFRFGHVPKIKTA